MKTFASPRPLRPRFSADLSVAPFHGHPFSSVTLTTPLPSSQAPIHPSPTHRWAPSPTATPPLTPASPAGVGGIGRWGLGLQLPAEAAVYGRAPRLVEPDPGPLGVYPAAPSRAAPTASPPAREDRRQGQPRAGSNQKHLGGQLAAQLPAQWPQPFLGTPGGPATKPDHSVPGKVRSAEPSRNKAILRTSPGWCVPLVLQQRVWPLGGGRGPGRSSGGAVPGLATRGPRPPDSEPEPQEHAQSAATPAPSSSGYSEGGGALLAPARTDSRSHSPTGALSSPNTASRLYPQAMPHHSLEPLPPRPVHAPYHSDTPKFPSSLDSLQITPQHNPRHLPIPLSPSLITPLHSHYCEQKSQGCMEGANPKGIFKN